MKKILIYGNARYSKCKELVKRGLSRLGYECKIINNFQKIYNCDFVISLSWNRNTKKIVDYYKNKNINTLCITDGYLNRASGHMRFDNYINAYFGITRNHINSMGYHEYETNLPDDRWKKLNINLKPWNKCGENIVIAHQHGEANDFSSRFEYFDMVIHKCLNLNKKIIICTHPRARKKNIDELIKYKKLGCEIIKDRTYNHLNNCYLVVTHDSNSGVESIINGIPVYSEAKTMIEHVKTTNLCKPIYIDRSAWCNWIAYQQWTFKEMESGEAFGYFGL